MIHLYYMYTFQVPILTDHKVGILVFLSSFFILLHCILYFNIWYIFFINLLVCVFITSMLFKFNLIWIWNKRLNYSFNAPIFIQSWNWSPILKSLNFGTSIRFFNLKKMAETKYLIFWSLYIIKLYVPSFKIF